MPLQTGKPTFIIMKAATKPIKRSEQLAPLSREHHDGLLFVWKIRQGIEKKSTLEQMRNYALWFWRHHIKPHFYQEEKILLPHMPHDHPMRTRLIEEHEHIRELILGLDDEADKRTLVILCDLLDKHIRFEERELFGFLEQHLPKETLDEIYRELQKHPVMEGDDWKEKFWE
jgi:hemerythrin-like domain-containing protein